MTVHKVVSLECDGCHAKIGHEVSVAYARAFAKRMGWVKRHGLDYCKACARITLFSRKRVWRIIKE